MVRYFFGPLFCLVSIVGGIVIIKFASTFTEWTMDILGEDYILGRRFFTWFARITGIGFIALFLIALWFLYLS
jgi:hypothetical protein